MSKPQSDNRFETKNSSRRMASGGWDFVGKINFFAGVSIAFMVLAFAVIFTKGFNYGIDFMGGTEVQIRFAQKTDIADVRAFLESKGLDNAQIQTFAGTNDYLLRFDNVNGKDERETNELTKQRNIALTDGIREKFKDRGVEVLGLATVGPQVGAQLKRDSLLAAFYSLLSILIYVAMRFDYNFAPGAVLVLFHNAIISLGVLAVLGREINVQIMAAILTIIGYSLNDSIVVFDRVRENIHVYRDTPLIQIINRAINDTLGRSIVTSVTVLLSVLALWIFADGVIADFAFTMALGVIISCYASIYVAAPLILVFDRVKHVGAVKTA